MNEKRRHVLFIFAIFINFTMIMIYNFLTPYMSDDLWYHPGVMRSFSDLINEQINYHMTWTGRDVAHFLLRISFCFPKWVFNLCSSLMFIALSLLIYANIDKKKKFDVLSYGLIIILMWVCGVSFDQTILWMSGACNYLWTSVIILGFITVYRRKIDSMQINKYVMLISAFAMAFLGLLAGWCNENTSGGAILLAAILTADYMYIKKKNNPELHLPIWSISGLVGSVTGFIIMITAPGNRIRSEINMSEESQTGIMALLGRLLKLNDAVIRNLGILFCMIIILLIYSILKGIKLEKLKYVIIYLIVAIATIYALILTAIPMDRALFGAGVFTIIVCVQLSVYISENDVILNTAKYSFVVIMMLYLAKDYLSCGADLVRIQRELNERQIYVDEQKNAGNYDLILPELREEWNNRFTFIYHDNDINEDPDSYGNTIYNLYYGLNSVTGIPRDTWKEND